MDTILTFDDHMKVICRKAKGNLCGEGYSIYESWKKEISNEFLSCTTVNYMDVLQYNQH